MTLLGTDSPEGFSYEIGAHAPALGPEYAMSALDTNAASQAHFEGLGSATKPIDVHTLTYAVAAVLNGFRPDAGRPPLPKKIPLTVRERLDLDFDNPGPYGSAPDTRY